MRMKPLIGVALGSLTIAVSGATAGEPIGPTRPTQPVGPKYPTVRVSPAAASVAMRKQILAVNRWWVRVHKKVPCEGCTIRPPQSNLIWTYYLNQGYFINWVRATRDVLRSQARGDLTRTRVGGREVQAASRVVTMKNGFRFRVVESAYRAPDYHPAPWRDAMGNGLALTLVIPALPDRPTLADMSAAKEVAREYLNSFEVSWKSGGLMAGAPGGGRWYLEYAYRNGNRARVLNGFMQALVSLDRFGRQSSDLVRYDPEWGALRDRAELLVFLGVKELVRVLPQYDLGDGWSRYSLTRGGRAPLRYHIYHQQLLARLEPLTYLPENSRRTLHRYRMRWGGRSVTVSRPDLTDLVDPPIPNELPPGP
jgi:hypothetical protein